MGEQPETAGRQPEPVVPWYPMPGTSQQPAAPAPTRQAGPAAGAPPSGYGYAAPGVPIPPPPHGPGVAGGQGPRRAPRPVLVALAAALVVLVLLGGGFVIGRASAAPAPAAPASLMEALRLAEQGRLPCGNPPADALGAFVLRLCRAQQGSGGGVPGGGTTT